MESSIEIFIELTNQIFWDGYAEQLAKENPKQYNREYKDFLTTYSN